MKDKPVGEEVYQSAFGTVEPKEKRRLPSIDVETLSLSAYVDGYVSTDEVAEILDDPRFFNTSTYDGVPNLLSDRCNSLINSKTNLRLDAENVKTDEAEEISAKIGFSPMTRIRVHIEGIEDPIGGLIDIVKKFRASEQNIAYVNNGYSAAFVQLSDQYR